MLVNTKAIVLSSLKYSEADLIVSCFTEDFGLKTYLLRSILKARKGKLKASYFVPLTQLQIIANHKDKGTLESIREVKVIHPYNTLHTNVIKSSLVMFLSEMLRMSIKEEEENRSLYRYLEMSFIWLDLNDEIANFHLFFLLRLTNFLGFYPDTTKIDAPFFNLQEGCFQNQDTSYYCESGLGVEGLKKVIGIDFDSLYAIKTTKPERLEALNLLLGYYQLHLQGYKKPKSLAVLNQLFN